LTIGQGMTTGLLIRVGIVVLVPISNPIVLIRSEMSRKRMPEV
jgi:hypothetical protein